MWKWTKHWFVFEFIGSNEEDNISKIPSGWGVEDISHWAAPVMGEKRRERVHPATPASGEGYSSPGAGSHVV